MKHIVRAALAPLALSLVFAGGSASAQAPARAPSCDRACLEGYVNRYIQAMADQKVDPALFAREVKFTENGVQLPLGDEGLWFSASGIGGYRFYVPDVETQQVAFLGAVKEQPAGTTGPERLVGFVVRLKIENGRIAEIEQLASRADAVNSSSNRFPPTGEGVEKMGQPHPVFRAAVPASQRMSRADLVETANYYFTGLQQNDGKGYYPFTDDCDRYENGFPVLAEVMDPETKTRGRMGCKRQFEVALKNIVDRVRDRRFVAVDRERGIVFAFGFFDHKRINWTWQLGELFKIENGQIRRIEAIFHRAPYGICSGWSTYEQCMSSEIQDIR